MGEEKFKRNFPGFFLPAFYPAPISFSILCLSLVLVKPSLFMELIGSVSTIRFSPFLPPLRPTLMNLDHFPIYEVLWWWERQISSTQLSTSFSLGNLLTLSLQIRRSDIVINCPLSGLLKVGVGRSAWKLEQHIIHRFLKCFALFC